MRQIQTQAEQYPSAPCMKQASDVDDIMNLLGVPVMHPAAPASEAKPHTWDEWADHLRDVYKHQPNGAAQADVHLPTEVVDRYKEYDHPYDDQSKALEKVIAEQGIREPLRISTNGTHALLHEGNHRLAVAKKLGIPTLPVRVTMDSEVVSNGGTPVPLEPTLGKWVSDNHHRLRSFRGSKTAGEAAGAVVDAS